MAKSGAKILFGLFFFVVIAGGLAGGGAWYLTEHQPGSYRATVLLLLEPSTLAGGDTAAPRSLEAAALAELFQSDTMAENLSERLVALRKDEGQPWTETIEQVKKAMRVETRVALQTASQVIYDPAIKLHYTAKSPEDAASAANAWAEECVKLVQRRAMELSHLPVADALSTAEEQLQNAIAEQTQLRDAGHPRALEAAAIQGADAVAELKETIRRLEGNAARNDAALKALKAYAAKAPVAVALELSVKEADAEATLAGAKAESEYAVAKLAELEAAQAEAQAKWAEVQPRYEAIDAEVARLSQEVQSLKAARRAAERRGDSISVVSRAVPPSSPAGPHRYVIVAGAAVVGAIAGMIVYFGLLTLRVYARELDRS